METYVRDGRERKVARMARLIVVACTCLAALVGSAVAADRAAADVVWNVDAAHGPDRLVPGEKAQFVVTAANVGTTSSSGTVRLVSTLPAGVTATSASGSGWTCDDPLDPHVVRCAYDGVVSAPSGSLLNPLFRGVLPVLTVSATVDGDAAGAGENRVEVAEGGAAAAATDVDRVEFGAGPSEFGIVPGSFASDVFDAAFPAGTPVRQAGAHPFEARIDFDSRLAFRDDPDRGGEYTEPAGRFRTIEVRLPRGLIGDPQAVPRCDPALFAQAVNFVGTRCPPATQVGTIALLLNDGSTIQLNGDPNIVQAIPVYNMEPPDGAVAAFALALVGQPIWITATLDPTDYSVLATIRYTQAVFPVRSARLTLWGVPADSSHDPLRFKPDGNFLDLFGATTGIARRPFLTLPSECGVAGATRMRTDSWERPDRFVTVESPSATVRGCEKQRFDASLRARPTTTAADAPSGMDVDLSIAQDLTPDGLGTPPLRRAVIRFPAGMSVSPSSADGLRACTTAQIGLGTNAEPTCPDGAKIGSVRIDTPLLPEPLTGDVLLAAQNDNPFRTLLALYIVARGPGVVVKLPGRIDADPATGQLTATFDNNPQIPFSNLHVAFKTGPRAPLATPAACGTYAVTAELTAWNAAVAPVVSQSPFVVSGPSCGGRFAPGFEAGSVNPVAGAETPFTMTLTRGDGDDALKGIAIATPRGFTGKIASVPLCPEANAAAGTCPAESRVGTATTGAGPGTNPLFIKGGVYFTGPYKGAPFGMSIVVPAVAGPFDLGTVNVRAAVFVDRTTAELSIVADPLPTILAGIPLRIRVVNVAVDRPGFILNPTNCEPMEIRGEISSDGGRVARVSTPFQATDCGTLPFRPKLTFRAGRRGHVAKNRSTPLVTTVTMPPGDANLKRVDVTLPLSLNARLPVVNAACSAAEYDAGDCERARVGSAVAETPLLNDPLTGGAYFVKRPGQSLPDIVVALRGQVDFDLIGKVRIPGGKRLGTRFDAVPDVPITRFTLSLRDGRQGAVGTAESLCSKAGRNARAAIRLVGQNGRAVTTRPKLRISGCGKHAKKAKKAKKQRKAKQRARARAKARRAAASERAARIAVRRAR